jgi:hypothetical protein
MGWCDVSEVPKYDGLVEGIPPETFIAIPLDGCTTSPSAIVPSWQLRQSRDGPDGVDDGATMVVLV